MRRIIEKLKLRFGSKAEPPTDTTDRRRPPELGILAPFAAILGVIGLIALIIVGIRSLAGRSEVEPAPPQPPDPPQPPAPPQSPAPPVPRRRGPFRFGIRHPLVIALIVVAVVVAGTLAYLPFSERSSTIDGIRHEPSEYDEFFTYSQMEAMTHFAKCDAMLFSTRPEEELENVKERMAIEVEFNSSAGPGASSRAGQYTRRVRSPEEIAEAIRLAEDFYERVNCQ